MTAIDVDLVLGRAGSDPAGEIAVAAALLHAVAGGGRGPVLRCYRPLPTVAFGRRDSFLPGFAAAAAAARRHGFTPVIRGAGGRAAAYDDGCLILDEIVPAADAMSDIHDRFAEEAQRQARSLRGLGIDARVGAVPGEYCPGEFSVNARGATKLIGSAQRIVRGAWLLATVVVIDSGSADALRAVLTDVYAELGLEWDPATVGSVGDESPTATLDAVQRALLAGYEDRYRLTPASLEPAELAAAGDIVRRHRLDA
jgi:lipoate-protein ligase A